MVMAYTNPIERSKKDYSSRLKASLEERNVDSFKNWLKLVRDENFSFAIKVEKSDAEDKQLPNDDYLASMTQEVSVSFGEGSLLPSSLRRAAIPPRRDEGEISRTLSEVDRTKTD
jgi:hypothetical protein